MGTNVNLMTIAPIRNLPKQKNKSNCQSLIEALFFSIVLKQSILKIAFQSNNHK